MNFNEKIEQLSVEIDKQLLPIINKNGKVKECVYLDLPYHTNIGDVLIWRGSEYFLKRTMLKCLYSAAIFTYSEQKMKKIIKRDENILFFLHGGGNFGDLWEEHQIFRKNIIESYPDYQIIILPQTVFYNDKNKMKIDAELFAKHKNLTICARDRKSEQILKENFRNNILLVPDMAFCIHQKELQNFSVPTIAGKTLLLKRTDKEIDISVDYWQYISQKNFETHDWITMEQESMETKILYRLIGSRKIPNFIADLFAKNIFQKTMVKEGVKQLSKYENIYSTRLHTAILSVLLEKPFALFDNSYGKNSSFFETWLNDLDNAEFYK